MVIQEAAEMYLETILVIQRRQGHVRAIDIANEMSYSRPTVSEQMKKFRENGYVEVAENGFITLTDKGRAIAEPIWERHNVLSMLLMALGVSERTAREDACKIEHDLSDESFTAIKAYYHNKK
jgi:Mn-dependent DtxR family transcriptional regulator